MTTKPLKKRATYDDLRDIPDQFVAEMFDGELYASPRPAVPHAHAASVLGASRLDVYRHTRSPEISFVLSSIYEWEGEVGRGAAREGCYCTPG